MIIRIVCENKNVRGGNKTKSCIKMTPRNVRIPHLQQFNNLLVKITAMPRTEDTILSWSLLLYRCQFLQNRSYTLFLLSNFYLWITHKDLSFDGYFLLGSNSPRLDVRNSDCCEDVSDDEPDPVLDKDTFSSITLFEEF
jgi:hypothetical protein